jgi:predicted secreted Zn-dependent protease
VKPKYRILGILGHSLRNKIPIVGNQGEREVGFCTLCSLRGKICYLTEQQQCFD